VGLKSKMKHGNRSTASCPPGAARSLGSGLWSLEWLSDQHLSETGVVSSTRNIATKGVGRRGGQDSKTDDGLKRKKVKGVLRHPVHNLKRVARLPHKDRAAVMKILNKNKCKYKGSSSLKKAVRMLSKDLSEASSSSSSANNNDWKHWVVMHGSETVVREDLRSLGETIGVRLNGSNNMFGVLARKGKGKKKESAGVDGDGGGEDGGIV